MMDKGLVEFMAEFLTPERALLFDQVIKNRTKYLTVVLEDIFQPHNASAVLRTCDCFGIQDIHVIENRNKYEVNADVALGSSKWISLTKHNKQENNTLACINKLRKEGYRIIATTPHTNDTNLDDFDLGKGKAALLMGTELTGLSDIAMENADEFVKIPMHGFTESFNISVSAAIILHHLTIKLHKSNIDWRITEEEELAVRYRWIKNTLKKSNLIEKRYFKK